MAVELGRGRLQSKPLPTPGDVSVNGTAVRFRRPSLTEEYSVSLDGVQQDFIVEQRPDGEGELRLQLEVNGAIAEPMGNGARLVLARSGRNLAYHRLQVADARGRKLPARLEVISQARLSVVVEDADAIYPVRIDPTFSDADWISIDGLPGADGTVNAAAFDAAGNLYIGGSFTVVGNAVANHIAKWDGSSWSDLDGGLNGTVNAIAISGTNVYVGDPFTTAEDGNLTNGIVISVNGVARWNGSDWSALDAGVNGTVLALAVSGSDLYVGGSFTAATLVSASRVAKWNGLSWSALGSGTSSTVNALAVIGTDLYAGGTFTTAGGSSIIRIAKWNGSAWSALGAGIGGGTSPSVNALTVSGTDLYAAGAFTIPANNIAKWNGSAWAAVGGGLGGTANSMALSGSDLYVGGAFTTPATRIAKWDGSTWSALDTGMNGTVSALATYGNAVAAGGAFTTPATRVAAWNGTSWTNLGNGLSAAVSAITVLGNDIYVGGSFALLGVPGAFNITRWNGLSWSALAGGLNGSVSAMAISGGNLYAGGSFTLATNTGNLAVTVNRIAQWNGSSWSALDVGVNNTVSALAVLGSDLYAGGSFGAAGPNPASRLARWNGTAWSPVGGGVDNTVNALAILGSDIVAAGSFATATNSGGVAVTAARIARWNGSAWFPLSSGFDNPANALAVSGATLYAGGFFNNAGGVPVGRIAQWNGSAWSVLGSATNNIFVDALAVSGSDLYVGGSFSQIGTLPVNNVAKWDGTNWTALGSGLTGTSIPAVNALAVHRRAPFTRGVVLTRRGTRRWVMWRRRISLDFPLAEGLAASSILQPTVSLAHSSMRVWANRTASRVPLPSVAVVGLIIQISSIQRQP